MAVVDSAGRVTNDMSIHFRSSCLQMLLLVDVHWRGFRMPILGVHSFHVSSNIGVQRIFVFASVVGMIEMGAAAAAAAVVDILPVVDRVYLLLFFLDHVLVAH